MQTQKCPKCDRIIPAALYRCPECRHQIKSSRKTKKQLAKENWQMVEGLIVFAILVVLFGSCVHWTIENDRQVAQQKDAEERNKEYNFQVEERLKQKQKRDREAKQRQEAEGLRELEKEVIRHCSKEGC